MAALGREVDVVPEAMWMVAAALLACLAGMYALRYAGIEQRRMSVVTRIFRLRRATLYYESQAYRQRTRLVGMWFLFISVLLLIGAVTRLVSYPLTAGTLAAFSLVIGKCLLSYRNRIHTALMEMSGAFPLGFVKRAAESNACARLIVLVGWLALLFSAGCVAALLIRVLR